VELALVLPLLCLVLIGSVELGRMAYAAIEVSNAARAAVAYGAQNLTTAKDSDGMAVAATADAANLTAMGASLSPPSADHVCVCDNGSSSPPTVNCTQLSQQCCPPGNTAACTGSGTYTGYGVEYVFANTSATVSTMFHYPGIPTSFTLHGYAKMRVLQD
jgi:Flp pilus assembly protein TadG